MNARSVKRAACAAAMVVVAAAYAAAGETGGVRMSARDVFGIAVDEPLSDCIRPADTNGIVTVSDGAGNYCFGSPFCGIAPDKFELGSPDDKGRRMVRMVKGEMPGSGIERREAAKRYGEVVARMNGCTNMKPAGRMDVFRDAAKSDAWTGVGSDGVPFAVGIGARHAYMNTNNWVVSVCVMDYGRFSEDGRRTDVPQLREEGREERLSRIEKKKRGRQARMMQEKAYSGKWGCKAKGYECIMFCFDKCGLGCFDMRMDAFMCAHTIAGGWFYWTADDKGEITIHAQQKKGGTRAFRLRYDFERNLMIPDLDDYPFAEKVIPDKDNPSCEMRFISDTTAVEVAGWSEDKRECPFDEMEAAAAEAIRDRLVERRASSFDELWAVVEGRLAKGGGAWVRRDGMSDVWVDKVMSIVSVGLYCEIERKGDPNAPKFDCIAKRAGPDVAGKKEREVFFDFEEISRVAKEMGGKPSKDEIEDKGAWSYEKRVFFSAQFAQEDVAKVREFLEYVMGKYEFPLKVMVAK